MLLAINTYTSFGSVIVPILLAISLIAVIVDILVKRRKKNKFKKAISGLSYGDKVLLCNGMVATFCSKANDTVEVELLSGAKARFMEWSVIEINDKRI